MKVLLIQPPISDFYDTKIRTYPLGLLYLGGKVKDICNISLLDLRSGYRPKESWDPFFDDLKEFYKRDTSSPFSLFSKFYYFGMDKNLIKKKILEYSPDLVCISSLFSTYFYDALEIARLVKELNKNVPVVFGGNHPTHFPEEVLRYKEIDFVIRGEGETPLLNLIKALKGEREVKGIEGLCYKRDDELFISPINVEKDINILPERSLLDSSRYKIGKSPYVFMLTSRGCPKNCIFCGKPPYPFRKISIETIRRDLENCLNLGISHIDFEDDMLTLDKGHFEEVLKLFDNLNLSLTAMNGLYPENLTEGLLDKMYRAGFRRLNISMVDLSREVIKTQNRFSTNFRALLKSLESKDFLVEVHFIIGLPQQKPSDVMDTLIFLMERRCLPAPSIFYLAPGSEIFNIYRGILDFKALRSSYIIEFSENFNRKTTYTLLLLSRFINFVKAFIDKNPEIKSLSELKTIFEDRVEEIFCLLLKEKKFYSLNMTNKNLIEEPVEKDLIELFFKKAKNTFIKGFKTENTIIFDI